ncbi:hypothetical protein KI387_030048, partial [Taxus chinensis]
MPGTPVHPKDVEEPRDEDMKDEEEGAKEGEEIKHDIYQNIEDPTPNLGAQISKWPRMKITSGEYVGPSMGYAEDTSKIVCTCFQRTMGLKGLYGWELMDPDMATMCTRKQLSWSMKNHMEDPDFDV